jgi:hypothetical protein
MTEHMQMTDDLRQGVGVTANIAKIADIDPRKILA